MALPKRNLTAVSSEDSSPDAIVSGHTIALPAAVKGGEDAGHWTIAWRSDYKIHVLTGGLGRPAIIRLTPGSQRSPHCR
jgi:hypothetical protein